MVAYSQTPAEINKALGLPDSLAYESEIRVYKDRGISNCSQVFRFYKDGKEWKAALYYFFTGGKTNTTDMFINKNLDGVWWDILNTNILYIPDEKEIKYKLEKRSKGRTEEGVNGYFTTHTAISDGTGYEIFIRSFNEQNHINYSNPESYLKIYPGVDELEFIRDLLDIIRTDFNIWKQ
ncbi:hypothetical protein AM493_00430 [Flavobacterium akiainvivens]|uniref:Uncharacterized protein n=1 Tax=Flavobacterium akiainvivens TaxID=1202724 RepID=A0A0M9VGP5_9FLAO|nr:hypothetical protein AM493_00430 [Flavobacterium akiainvivens]